MNPGMKRGSPAREPGERAAGEPAAPGKPRPWYRRLGPGLLAGSADDDPGGIAVYSQAGSQFGFQMLWLIALALPLMVAVQIASARIGRGACAGLLASVREHGGARLAKCLAAGIALVSLINVGADLSAMGGATALAAGGHAAVYAAVYGLGMLAALVRLPYARHARVMKWLTLTMLAYAIEVALVDIDWSEAGRALLHPRIVFSHDYATTAVAVLGTTISPYLFVWQAALEHEQHKTPARAESTARHERRRITLDTWAGMLISSAVAICIMLVGAAVFHAHGQTSISGTEQAASALRPIAGRAAALVFTLGVVGCGLLAVPAYAASAAYGIVDAWRLRGGLDAPTRHAPVFYGAIGACLMAGIGFAASGVDPIRALYWSAVLNGVAAVPMLVLLLRLAARGQVVGRLRSGMLVIGLGWIAVALMVLAVGFMLVDLLRGG